MKTKELKFHGDSDDNFHIYGTAGLSLDYIGAFDKKIVIKVQYNEQGLLVTGEYAPSGIKACSWNFGVSHIDEGIPIPADWVITIGNSECNYSPQLTITMPFEHDMTYERLLRYQ